MIVDIEPVSNINALSIASDRSIRFSYLFWVCYFNNNITTSFLQYICARAAIDKRFEIALKINFVMHPTCF